MLEVGADMFERRDEWMPFARQLRIRLDRRRQLRPLYRAAAEARISAEWRRRGDDCRRMFNKENEA